MIKTFITNLIVTLTAVLLTFMTLEISLRVLNYTGRGQQNIYFIPWMKEANIRNDWKTDFNISESKIIIHGVEVPINKNEDETRVLFIGDSGTYGVGVTLEETFSFQFKYILDKSDQHNNIRVINAGAPGMTLIDAYHFLTNQLTPLSPDIVVLGIFMANDINFNLAHREYSYIPLSNNILLKCVDKLIDNSALFNFCYLRLLALNSKYNFVDYTSNRFVKYFPYEISLIDTDGFHMLDYAGGEIATYKINSSDLIQYAYEVLKKAMNKFKIYCQLNNIKFVAAIIPTSSTISNKLNMLGIDNEHSYIPSGLEEKDFDFYKPTRLLLDICKRLNVVCYDPTQKMKKIGLDVILPGDDHLSAKGHRVLAEMLAENYPFLK